MLSCRCPRLRATPSAPVRGLLAILLGVACVWAYASSASAQGQPVTFSVIGDIPYSGKEGLFQGFVDDHNLKSPSKLFFHVGDIKSQTDACPEPYYAQTFDIMAQLAVPSFIVPGDNEWNDCDDPDLGWSYWETYFLGLEQNF